MDKLSLFNRMSEIEVFFRNKANKYVDFFECANEKIHEMNEKVIQSNFKSIVKNSGMDLSEIKKSSKGYFDVDKAWALPSYSSYNPFVWLRLAGRKKKLLNRVHNEYQNLFRMLLTEVKDVESNLSEVRLKRREERRLNDFLLLKDKVRSLRNFNLRGLSEFEEPLILAFSGNIKLSKNNFLSLITINHDLRYWDGPENETMKFINELPDEIDYETLRDAAFIQKLEHDQDCYLFDIYMGVMLKAISENPELSDAAFDKFQEAFGPIQTYTTVTDEDGEIVSVTPNKPDLKVVK